MTGSPIDEGQEVERQRILTAFQNFVTDTANAGIVWGKGNPPFSQFDQSEFGGSPIGEPLQIDTDDIGTAGGEVSATQIYNTLVAETARYTNIRNLRARRFLTGFGYDFDNTQVAEMNNTYEQNIGVPAQGDIQGGENISCAELDTLFTTLQTSYNTARANTVTLTTVYCHSSCHASCHASRNRR